MLLALHLLLQVLAVILNAVKDLEETIRQRHFGSFNSRLPTNAVTVGISVGLQPHEKTGPKVHRSAEGRSKPKRRRDQLIAVCRCRLPLPFAAVCRCRLPFAVA